MVGLVLASERASQHDHQELAVPELSLVAVTHCWVEFCCALWLVAVLDEQDRASAGSLRVSPSSLNMSTVLFPYIIITYVNEERDCASRFELARHLQELLPLLSHFLLQEKFLHFSVASRVGDRETKCFNQILRPIEG
jgi:hypothetical protein